MPLTSAVLGQFKETYDPLSYLLEWGGSGTGDREFVGPAGVAVDAVGNVYVAGLRLLPTR